MKWKLGKPCCGVVYYATKGEYTISWDDTKAIYTLYRKDKLVMCGSKIECVSKANES